MIWAKIAGLIMAWGVGMGAFGSHALRTKLDGYSMEIYKTAVLYHLVHGLGLFIIAWLKTENPDPRLNLAGLTMLIGIILFSGSLYALAITGIKQLGAITPLGGLSFLIAWFFIFLAIKA